MKLLIVEDDPQLRRLLVAELREEAKKRGIELAIAEEDNLGDALPMTYWCDTILCDGEFWDRPNPAFRRLGNWWPVLHGTARGQKKDFVLHTGSDRQAEILRSWGYGFVVMKPAAAHVLAEAVFGIEVRSQNSGARK